MARAIISGHVNRTPFALRLQFRVSGFTPPSLMEYVSAHVDVRSQSSRSLVAGLRARIKLPISIKNHCNFKNINFLFAQCVAVTPTAAVCYLVAI